MSDQPALSSTAPQVFRLLVVDDNDDNRSLLSRRLKSKGYEVDIAADGPSALEACAKVTYDAILLDVMMPGMSGIEVLEKLRQTRGKTELSVIMATAKNDSTSVVDALKRGANDYVTKPIDFPVLLARIETQLAMKVEAAAAADRAAAHVDVTFGIAPGTILCNRYEILEKRGEGGFAVVYRARQLSTNRDVALKHLRPDVLSSTDNTIQLERFERESRLIGELNHPNVVRLIDSGSIAIRPAGAPLKPTAKGPPTLDAAAAADALPALPGENSQTRRKSPEKEATLVVPYIVMELLSGESLSELIEREAPLECARAIDLILPVLSALSAAHDRGVIHRDVKPSNIMLTDDRGEIEPKVLDFGIAKLTAREGNVADLTISASLIGTPQYMPPEQAFGKKDLDGRVDQFSAGAVLYQMLTGRSPYSGDSLFDLVSKVLAGEYTPLAEVRPDLPKGLVDVVACALANQRDDRHASMRAFGRALLPYASDKASRRWSDHFTVEPTPSGALIMNVERSERHPGIAEIPEIRGTESTLESPIGAVPIDRTLQVNMMAVVAKEKVRIKTETLANTLESVPARVEPEKAAEVEAPAAVVDEEKPAAAAAAAIAKPQPTRLASKSKSKSASSPSSPAASSSSSSWSWERVVLLILATAVVFYALGRFVFRKD